MQTDQFDIDLDDSQMEDSPAMDSELDQPDYQIYLASDSAMMKDKLLPSLADEEIETELEFSHTWNITDWRALPPKIYSDPFDGGDFTWKFYLFPEGNRTAAISIYLACAPKGQDPANPSSDDTSSWACCAQFGIVMWNPEDPTVMASSVASHRFCASETDWGFSQFHDLRGLFMRHVNSEHALIEDNKVNISVYVKIVKDPTGTLWHSFQNYNSKKETGYSGMKNQGATCYLNSLLQSLYFTTAFRHAVLGIPTEDEPDKVPAALQRVFCQLYTSDGVDTLKLTRSFGWDSGDAFTQHDVQELNRVLMDNLEGEMKRTSVDGSLNEIFVGQMKSYVKCVNVDFESSRIEDYWDIQLNVKGMKTLEDSFKDYVQVEMLDGENQYMATGYGLQDAKKGVVFTSFPPVLHLQLKRYDFDFMREMMVKINDRYEFPTEIDLSPYLDESVQPSEESYEYALHGVLVHSGDLNIGHYYALIKPQKDGPWYKFDDDLVTQATLKEVLEDNFGGEPLTTKARMPTSRLTGGYKRHTSAYMLVYIRKSRLDDILYEEGIPQHIQDRVQKEIDAERALQQEKEEQHWYMPVKVATLDNFKNLHHFDLAVWDADRPGLEDQPTEAQAVTYKAKKDITPAEFIKQIAESINYTKPLEGLRLWTMIRRDNKTYRLNSYIRNLSENCLKQLLEKGYREGPELHLYLEELEVDPVTQKPLEDDGNNILLFIKHFDPATQNLQGEMTLVAHKLKKVKDLVPAICQKLGWPADTPLRLLEEVKPLMIDVLDMDAMLVEAELGDGDVICVEKLEDESLLTTKAVDAVVPFKTATEYYDFLHARVLVTFRRHNDLDQNEVMESEDTPDIKLWLGSTYTYDQMAQAVGESLGVEPDHLHFFTINPAGTLKQPVKRGNTPIFQIIMTSYRNHAFSRVLAYQVLRMSVDEFESKKLVQLVYLTEGLSHEHRHEMLLSQASTVSDIVDYLVSKSNLTEQEEKRLVLWTAKNHVVVKGYLPRHMLIEEAVDEGTQVYGQLLTEQEYEWLSNEAVNSAKCQIIRVFQYHRDTVHMAHGVPFMFLLLANEPFKDTKIRLQKKLGMYDKVFERIKFSVVRGEAYNRAQYIEKDDIVLFDHVDGSCVLGLDHMKKTVRQEVQGERAIFIKS